MRRKELRMLLKEFEKQLNMIIYLLLAFSSFISGSIFLYASIKIHSNILIYLIITQFFITLFMGYYFLKLATGETE